jgi:hypothetical protein
MNTRIAAACIVGVLSHCALDHDHLDRRPLELVRVDLLTHRGTPSPDAVVAAGFCVHRCWVRSDSADVQQFMAAYACGCVTPQQ